MNRQKFPLRVVKGSPEVYAELLAVAAQISWFHNKWDEAFEELYYALEFDPLHTRIKQQYDQYEKYVKKVYARRRVRNSESKTEAKKIEGMMVLTPQITLASMLPRPMC